MEYFGRVKEIGQVVSGQNERGTWQRQTIVLESFENPNNCLALDALGDRLVKLATLQIGQAVKAVFAVSSRKGDNGWFTSATLWDIAKL